MLGIRKSFSLGDTLGPDPIWCTIKLSIPPLEHLRASRFSVYAVPLTEPLPPSSVAVVSDVGDFDSIELLLLKLIDDSGLISIMLQSSYAKAKQWETHFNQGNFRSNSVESHTCHEIRMTISARGYFIVCSSLFHFARFEINHIFVQRNCNQMRINNKESDAMHIRRAEMFTHHRPFGLCCRFGLCRGHLNLCPTMSSNSPPLPAKYGNRNMENCSFGFDLGNFN